MKQAELTFAEPRSGYLEPGALGYSNQTTSLAAAESVAGNAGTRRRAVFEFLVERGARGGTDEEIIDHFGGPTKANGIRPRRVELVNAGAIMESGHRITRSGRQALVWVAR